MSEDSNQERTETATDKRRGDFREKGQVAQSREINTAALLTCSLILWVFYAPFFLRDLQQLMAHLFRITGSFELTALGFDNLCWTLGRQMGLLLFPVFLLTMLVGFLSSYLQIGPLFTLKPFTDIDLSKFDPIKGMGRFISKRSFIELLKSTAKVTLVGVIAYRTVAAEVDGALDLVSMEPVQLLSYLGRITFLVVAKACGLLILLALLDFLFVRWEMEEKMKMTKQEIKEEFKESEGDPQIKARVRQMQMQMARRRMMAEVPKADVIITNPTHFAIALSYDRSAMDAPKVIAKGADHMAFKIREIAKEHKIPIVENKPVARALYQVELGEMVPEEMFKAVAEILAYVYSLKRKS